MYSAPRAATVRAMTACQLWVMDRAVYVALKQHDQRQLIEDKRKAVNQVPMLAVLSQVSPSYPQPINQCIELLKVWASTPHSPGFSRSAWVAATAASQGCKQAGRRSSKRSSEMQVSQRGCC